MESSCRTLVVGIGSPHGDDQAGWHVAESLRDLISGSRDDLRDPAGNTDLLIRNATIPLDLLDWLDGVDTLHVIDACDSPDQPGTICRLEWSEDGSGQSIDRVLKAPTLRRGSSHDLGVVDVLQLAERVRSLPPRVVIWAVTGSQFGPGAALDESVRDGAVAVISRIAAELRVPRRLLWQRT